MLDIKFIRDNPEKVKKSLKDRGVNFDLDELIKLDEKRRAKIKVVDDFRSKQNAFSDGIAQLEGEEKNKKIEESKELKISLVAAELELKALEKKFEELMYELPNIPHENVPVGKDEAENKILKTWGEIPKFSFKPRDHVEIGELLDIIDIERAAKVSGTRFNYLKGGAALLEFALVQFVLQTLTLKETVKKLADSVAPGYSDKVFIPVIPPVMIRPAIFKKMGRLNPQDKDERYYLPQDDLYLIGSAEHTLGSMHADEIIPEKDFPVRYMGFSTSFRREAGSYGKDTRGILRVHQFDKLEMESFTLPENSYKEHEFFIAVQEYLVQSLKLPYHAVVMCTGDTGKPNARQHDLETWMPGQNEFRETHTADYMTDFQARRLNTKVRRENGAEFAHTNDATAIAIGRTLVAILENYQQEDGSVAIPEVLQKYMGGIEAIR